MLFGFAVERAVKSFFRSYARFSNAEKPVFIGRAVLQNEERPWHGMELLSYAVQRIHARRLRRSVPAARPKLGFMPMDRADEMSLMGLTARVPMACTWKV